MRLADMPVAKLGRLVILHAEVHAEWNVAVLQCVGEAQVSRRVEYRVAAKYDQQVNFAAAHVGDKILDRVVLVLRGCENGIGIEDGFADVTEPLIYRMS